MKSTKTEIQKMNLYLLYHYKDGEYLQYRLYAYGPTITMDRPIFSRVLTEY